MKEVGQSNRNPDFCHCGHSCDDHGVRATKPCMLDECDCQGFVARGDGAGRSSFNHPIGQVRDMDQALAVRDNPLTLASKSS